jgi:hypothetical protein
MSCQEVVEAKNKTVQALEVALEKDKHLDKMAGMGLEMAQEEEVAMGLAGAD